jgi:hypothetical protein
MIKKDVASYFEASKIKNYKPQSSWSGNGEINYEIRTLDIR